MSSPIITDEQLEKEQNTKNAPKKTMEQIVKETKFEDKIVDSDEGFMNKEILEETEKDIADDIPSSYIEINLVSNGRIKGIPNKLHFRCYSASDAVDLNVDEDNKTKAIAKVLTRLCYEKFDISLLPVADILYILYKLHGAFISQTITKKVYIDDKIEDEEKLNSDDNMEEVEIPITSLVYAYLGKDYDDNELEPKIKVPFTVKDNITNDKVQFRYTILKDMIVAEKYCRNYYKDEFIKFADIRSTINKINSNKDEEKRDSLLDKYLTEHEELANEYYDFMLEFAKKLAKVVQCEAITSYNGKELEDIDEKWEVYENKVSVPMWEQYNSVLEKYPFGIKEEIEVFIPSLNKVVQRRVGFQFDDFLRIDKQKDPNRCTVEFD